MADVLEQAAETHLAVEQIEALRTDLLKERRDAVLAAQEAGSTPTQIAAKLGLSKQRVAKILSGNAPPKTRRQKFPTPVDL